jgi:exodeoxyribonuclease III
MSGAKYEPMKIFSWNINSLRRREDQLLHWLEASKPEVVCLQETKCTDEQFPELALRTAGYYCAFHGQKSYNGVAILSRSPLQDVQISLCDEEEDLHARVIAATVNQVRVYSIYAPNGQAVGSPAFDYKLKWYSRLYRCLLRKESEARYLTVCGDLNVAPKDEDVFDPELWRGAIMCSDQERAAFQQLCSFPLIDTLRIHHSGPDLFSWWDYRMQAFAKNRGLRIDAVLASKELAARSTGAGIDREMRKGSDASDHAPVWAEFSL